MRSPGKGNLPQALHLNIGSDGLRIPILAHFDIETLALCVCKKRFVNQYRFVLSSLFSEKRQPTWIIQGLEAILWKIGLHISISKYPISISKYAWKFLNTYILRYRNNIEMRHSDIWICSKRRGGLVDEEGSTDLHFRYFDLFEASKVSSGRARFLHLQKH